MRSITTHSKLWLLKIYHHARAKHKRNERNPGHPGPRWVQRQHIHRHRRHKPYTVSPLLLYTSSLLSSISLPHACMTFITSSEPNPVHYQSSGDVCIVETEALDGPCETRLLIGTTCSTNGRSPSVFCCSLQGNTLIQGHINSARKNQNLIFSYGTAC